MELYEAIRTRKTIRDFEEKSIPPEVIERMLGAGMQAPSNNHLREWEFIVITDQHQKKALIQSIHELTAPDQIDKLLDEWKMTDQLQRNMYHNGIPKQKGMIVTAGAVILPCFRVTTPLLKPKNLSDLNYFASIWCCIENILLAAAAEGIFGVVRIPFDDEVVFMRHHLGIPADYEVPCYLALGYPKANAFRQKQVNIDIRTRIHSNCW